MEAITQVRSRTVVLPSEDIDTDQIIPARFLTTTTKQGLGENLFADWRYDADGAWAALDDGRGVIVSEPLAYRRGIRRGDVVTLASPAGNRRFEVVAIHYDYASERGAVLIDDALYERLWADPLTTAASISDGTGRAFGPGRCRSSGGRRRWYQLEAGIPSLWSTRVRRACGASSRPAFTAARVVAFTGTRPKVF